MWNFTELLISYPELTAFAAIAIGYVLGNFRFGSFSFGPVAGSLFAGLFIGQFAEVPVAPMAKSFLFLLFLFGIGYSAGPQFLKALKRGGAQPVVLAVVCTTTGLMTAFVLALVLQLDIGMAAGLMAGGLTQSPAIGSASEAIALLGLPEAETKSLTSNVAIAYAVCYVFGSAGAIWFCSYLGPKLLRVDLKAEAIELGRSLGMDKTPAGVEFGYRQFQFRAYRVPEGSAVEGRTIALAEQNTADKRLYILRVRRGGELLAADPDFVIAAGDILAISGPRAATVECLSSQAEEIEDTALLDIPFRAAKIIFGNRELDDKPLSEIAACSWARGIYLRSITRGGNAIPVAPGIHLDAGDVLDVIGPQDLLATAAPRLGRELKPSQATDFIVLGMMIFLGGMIGVLARFTIMGIEMSIGTSVGVLLAGLLTGYLRTRHPFFGRIPDGAIALMTSLGLAAFIAMVGLQSGPSLIPTIANVGLVLPAAALVVCLTPLLVGLMFGRFVLKMNPILLLGALGGSQTATPAMAAVQARADSPLPVLGYAPAYPVAQVLLTMWGSIIVLLVN